MYTQMHFTRHAEKIFFAAAILMCDASFWYDFLSGVENAPCIVPLGTATNNNKKLGN